MYQPLLFTFVKSTHLLIVYICLLKIIIYRIYKAIFRENRINSYGIVAKGRRDYSRIL